MRMLIKSLAIMLFFIFLLLLPDIVFGQCSLLTTSDLGNVNAPSTSGLLSDILAAESNGSNPSVQILQKNIVCLSQGLNAGEFVTTSVVVNYLRMSDNMTATLQIDLTCSNGMWVFRSNLIVEHNPIASITTATRSNCIICIHPSVALTVNTSMLEHCGECNYCPGLGSCIGSIFIQSCCSYFDFSGICVTTCPSNASPNATFYCECDPGYNNMLDGSNCAEINECELVICENGGTCVDLPNDFSCVCVPGYTGRTCDIADINECYSDPCKNGATCTDMINNFSCSCAPGFTGETCMTNIDNCDPNPCMNGGTCTNTISGFSCSCAPGFTAVTCATDINECDSDPCENDGNCTDTIDGFLCDCIPGFTGETCIELHIPDNCAVCQSCLIPIILAATTSSLATTLLLIVAYSTLFAMIHKIHPEVKPIPPEIKSPLKQEEEYDQEINT